MGEGPAFSHADNHNHKHAQGLVGGNAFIGGGVYHATAVSMHDSASTSSEFGAVS